MRGAPRLDNIYLEGRAGFEPRSASTQARAGDSKSHLIPLEAPVNVKTMGIKRDFESGTLAPTNPGAMGQSLETNRKQGNSGA